MKILLTGRTGMVGWELHRSLQPLGEVIALGREQADLSQPQVLRAFVREVRPDVIVNAAAYTAVDRAEAEETLATVVNAESPGVLAEEAKRCGALLVHYSTDYVFDGTKDGPYVETDAANPINAYGRSKLAGEQAIQAGGADHLILRTSWVYAARGHNFLLTMLRLMRERDELRVVADQFGAPTWARTIADTTAHCIRQVQRQRAGEGYTPGIFHLASSGKTSWHGFAEKIAGLLADDIPVGRIIPIGTSEYATAASRPANSTLNSTLLASAFTLSLPAWDEGVELVMRDLAEK